LSNNFHISVASTPDSSEELLFKEIQMLKTALIYADKTRLYSLSANFLLLFLGITNFNFAQKVEMLKQLIPTFNLSLYDLNNFNTVFSSFSNLNKKRHKNFQEMHFLQILQSQIENAWNEFTPKIFEFLESSGLAKLSLAYEKGLVEIYGFKELNNTNLMIQEYVDEIVKTTKDNGTFPFLDELSADIIKAKISENSDKLSKSSVERIRHTGIISQLMNRLPCFEVASLDEIIDIRSALSKHLIRFRTIIFEFSDEIELNIWDDEFEYEVNKKYFQKIEPVILEIEEAIEENTYLKTIISKAIEQKVITSPLIGLSITGLNNFQSFLPAALGVVTGLAQLAITTNLEVKRKNKQIEGNQLFFYYKAGKLLEK